MPQTEIKPVRRSFLKKIWAVLGLSVLGEFLWVVFSFVMPKKEPSRAPGLQSIDAGIIDAYEPGSVTAFVNGQFYLVCLDDGGFLALSNKCTHLGCALPWIPEKKQFICPCHASVFDIRGNVLSSPAPRAMDFFKISITNKQIQVDTGDKTQRSRFNKSDAAYPESITMEKKSPA